MLNNNIFTFNGKYYHQISGLAMGSRIAPVIAIVMLDRIERQVLQAHSYLAIKLFRRYFDDCFLLIDEKTDPSDILCRFNYSHASIKFEVEHPSTNNSLSILDVIRMAILPQNFTKNRLNRMSS